MDDLDGVDGPVRRFFERIAGPAAATTPDLEAIGAAIVDLATDADYGPALMRRLGEAPRSLLIHGRPNGPRLSIVRRPEGQMSALHDHGTWVAISPIAGQEAHRRYAVDGAPSAGLPRLVEVRALEPANMPTLMPPNDVHDHGHMAGQGIPAYVLIATGADQTQFVRNEWDLVTGRHRLLRPASPAAGWAVSRCRMCDLGRGDRRRCFGPPWRPWISRT